MRTNVLRSVCLLAILCLTAGTWVAAHPGHDHKVMGTIASIDRSKVVVRTTEGQEKSVEITSTTKLTRGKKRGMVQELRVGMRVVVNVGDGAEPLKAKELQYPDTPTTQR